MVKHRSGSGLGLDLGFVYELKKSPSEYKLRLGVSVTDIGSVKYTNSANSQNYTLTTAGHNTSELQKQDGETYDDYFTRLKTAGLIVSKGVAPMAKVSLPTALHLNIDYDIFKRLFINADVLFNMVANSNPVNPNYITTFTVTPRLEKKWVSIYSPVSYNVEGQLNWGAGIRFGPLFVGSGSVLSSLLKQRIQTADVHAGLTIPIFQHDKDKKHTKADTVYRNKDLTHDRDGDGVVDEKDECPDSAGPIALIGCPDRDGDGVPDKKDKCPDVKGSPNFQGCPAPDSDGDSVNDDEDKCPLVKGLKSNYGCPPIKPEYITGVNRAADRVFFVRAKATIEKSSLPELDRVVTILETDTTLRLRIEGNTDSEGTDERNLSLSARRARAVRNYLEKQGIPAARMDYIGLGSKHPLATNETREGMAQNRRVEMILMNYPKDKK
jgi:outer membrane protein OmpA-like peptidoglycan-associated protein